MNWQQGFFFHFEGGWAAAAARASDVCYQYLGVTFWSAFFFLSQAFFMFTSGPFHDDIKSPPLLQTPNH